MIRVASDAASSDSVLPTRLTSHGISWSAWREARSFAAGIDPVPPSIEERNESQALLRPLGVSERMAERIAAEAPPSWIVLHASSARVRTAKNRAGMLVAAMRDRFELVAGAARAVTSPTPVVAEESSQGSTQSSSTKSVAFTGDHTEKAYKEWQVTAKTALKRISPPVASSPADTVDRYGEIVASIAPKKLRTLRAQADATIEAKGIRRSFISEAQRRAVMVELCGLLGTHRVGCGSIADTKSPVSGLSSLPGLHNRYGVFFGENA